MRISTSEADKQTSLQQIIDLLREHCLSVRLRRLDESSEHLEASFQVEYESFEQLERNRRGLRDLDGTLKVTFVDNRGIGA